MQASICKVKHFANSTPEKCQRAAKLSSTNIPKPSERNQTKIAMKAVFQTLHQSSQGRVNQYHEDEISYWDQSRKFYKSQEYVSRATVFELEM